MRSMPQSVTGPYTEQCRKWCYKFADSPSKPILYFLRKILYRFCKGNRIEYVILKPGTQCNMPSVPEI